MGKFSDEGQGILDGVGHVEQRICSNKNLVINRAVGRGAASDIPADR